MKKLAIGGQKRLSINRPTTSLSFSHRCTRNHSNILSTSRSTASSKTSTTCSFESDTEYPPISYEEVCSHVLNPQSLKDLETKTLLHFKSSIKDHIAEMVISENYDECKNSLKTLQVIKNELSSRTMQQTFTNQVMNDDFDAQQEEINKRYNDKIQETNEKFDSKTEQMKIQHQQQMEKFDSDWSTVELNKYRKPSKNLLNLKEIEKFCAKANQFADAKAIHEEEARLAEQETMNAQEKLIKDYRYAKINLKLQQQKDLHIIDEMRKAEIRNLEHNKEMDLLQLKKRYNVLQIKSKPKNSPTTKRFVSNVHLSHTARPPVLLGPLAAPNDRAMKRKMQRDMIEKRKLASRIIQQNPHKFFDDGDSIMSFSTIGSRSDAISCLSQPIENVEINEQELDMLDIYMEVSQPKFSLESLPLDCYN